MRLRIDHTLVEVEVVVDGDYKDQAIMIFEAIVEVAPWAANHMPDPSCPKAWWRWYQDAIAQQGRWDSFDAFIAGG